MKFFTALFLLLACSLAQPALAQNLPVRFSWGAEYFPDNYQAIREKPELSPAELVNGYYYRYIQCREVPTAQQRALLENQGVQFIHYITFGAYLVALPQHFDIGQLENLQVRSIVPVDPQWKLAQNLRERPFGAWAVHGDRVEVVLQAYPQLRIDEAAERCADLNLEVLFSGKQNGFLHLSIPQDQLELLAAQPFVRYLELLPPPGEPEDTGGRNLHRIGLLDVDHPGGLHLNGEGVSVMVRDDGPLGPHIDFQGRNTDLFDPSDLNNSNHGDGVGGVMAGAGNLNPVMRGMATGAKIFTIRYQADFQDQTMDLHFNENVTITNSSYSNGCNAGYTTITQIVEQQLFDNPTLMHVFSGGNNNNAECGYGAGDQWGNITGGHKVAKNCIATANLYVDGTIVESSSRGPAHDGRLKPELAAHGQNQNSTDHNNTYQVFGGTSAAAPGIAGCMAVLTQAYKLQHNGEQPKAALLKTALMNTANDLGNPGPDFKFGYGHVNTWRAYQLLQAGNYLEGAVEQGAETTHTVQVPFGTRQAKIMLYWADPAASQNASRALINDLDIVVTAPDGTTTHLPWKLNTAPDPILLNAPAGRGRDSLNNSEQVVIDDPVGGGTYTITVKGYEVPMGPQDYFLAWEFYNDDVKLTFPSGGEGLVPGEVAVLQWDAYGTSANFTLRYSLDDGATWNPITTTAGTNRMFNWTIPNTISNQVRVLIIRGSRRDTTDFPLSIVGVPKNLKVEKVCPDEMTVSWSEVNDTLSYDVYTLGQKYMEIVGTTDTSVYTFPIQNAGNEQWFSVRASHPNGLAGRRAVAVRWAGGLKNCPQDNDVALGQILAPSSQALASVISCQAINAPVKVRVVNAGLKAIDGATLSYRLNNDPVVTEALPVIDSGATLDYTFLQTLSITANGQNTLRIWSTYANENVFFNDTLNTSFQAIVSASNQFFTQTFQTATFPPTGWSIGNPDNNVTWARTPTNVIGANGQNTRAAFLNVFNYGNAQGQEDYLYLPPINLSNLPSPGIRFDLAHANYDSTYSDSLRIEVFANCDVNSTPTIIWGKGGPRLATTLNSTAAFAPDAANDWRTEGASLQSFAGQNVIVRFASVNDFGNNIYIDNVGFIEYNTSPPVAQILQSADTICRLDTIRYTAAPAPLADYTWLFGSGAQPSNATGPGPHAVRYLSAGNKSVRLVVSNPNGADTSLIAVPVLGPPVAKFTWAASAGTVTFTNTSTSGQSYLWNFGDGATSTEFSPVHTYTASGDYTVTLTVTNVCTSATKSETFNVNIVSTKELPEARDIRILPNPTFGDFRVELNSTVGADLQFNLLDAQGRIVKTVRLNSLPGKTIVPFEGLNLATGLYQLQLQTPSGVLAFSIAVQ